jgi:hypothetical protein
LTAKFKRSLRRFRGLDPIIEDLAKAGASIRKAFLTREFEATTPAPPAPEIVDRLRALGGEVAIRRVSTPPF